MDADARPSPPPTALMEASTGAQIAAAEEKLAHVRAGLEEVRLRIYSEAASFLRELYPRRVREVVLAERDVAERRTRSCGRDGTRSDATAGRDRAPPPILTGLAGSTPRRGGRMRRSPTATCGGACPMERATRLELATSARTGG